MPKLFEGLVSSRAKTTQKLAAIEKSHCIAEFSLDGAAMAANANFLHLLGYSEAEIIASPYSAMLDAEVIASDEFRASWAAARRGETTRARWKHKARSGEPVWLDVTMASINDLQGRPARIVVIGRDATELAQATAIGDIEHAAVQNASLGIMAVDRNLDIVFVNKSATELVRENVDAFREIWSGLDPDNLVGHSIDKFHKNPAHQRRMLADPSNLPHRADIVVGEKRFELHVNAAMDAQQNYIGAVLQWEDVTRERVNDGMIAALQRSQAVIEFKLDGTIVEANENFLNTVGYTMEEIRGKHHSMFCEPSFTSGAEYQEFWRRLGRGEFDSGVYKRIGKGGREVWIRATYNPILDQAGRPFKVVKFASDITEVEVERNELVAKSNAMSRSQAVIEFELDGTIVTANENFLATLGYTLDEVAGRHHSMFVDEETRNSPDYAMFWERLRRGEFMADKYRRVGKGGKEVWIQASYNPLLDLDGNPYKVVKFASDVTAVEHERRAAEAESARRSQELADVVSTLAEGLGKLSDGDLTFRVDQAFPEEYERLRVDFNGAITQLEGAMQVILSNAAGINSGSGEISQAADDLSRRTEQQAASLEQTAAALDEITATVRKTAEGASEANSVGKQTREEAESGGEVVREAVDAMSEIESSAEKISQIIGVIDEIAFQTNLLALNAGVEAARAGEAGRGFAVVASEVRALAQRSSDAAKEIKSLIMASSQHVASGVDLVGRTGKALTEIVEKVATMSSLVGEIASSAEEQATGLSQVNTAVNQMDQVTQQNAAMVEESTAASHSLASEAAALTELVSKFRISDGGGVAAGGPVAVQQRRVEKFASEKSRSLAGSGARSAPAMKPQSNLAEDDWEEF